MKEHDVIMSISEIPNVPIGSEGTIVFEYSNGVFEVEFKVNGKSKCETCVDTDIKLK